MKNGLTILLLFVCLLGMAQGRPDSVPKEGTMQIVLDDPYIDSLLDAYKANASKDPIIKGYRVQVFSATNRTDLNKVKSQFYTLFPDVKTFVIYQQPNFKLRVGNFRTRLEAYKAWVEINKQFPGAFITPEEIKMSKL